LTVCKGKYYSKFILTHKFEILSQWNNNKCAFHDVFRLDIKCHFYHSLSSYLWLGIMMFSLRFHPAWNLCDEF